MNIPPPLTAPNETVEPSPLRIIINTLGFTLLCDFLFWGAVPGLSVTLFIITVCAALLLNRPLTFWSQNNSGIHCGLLVLLFATAVQSAVELSFSNILVALVLIVGFLGEMSYPHLHSYWERWSAASGALLKAPGRWSWVANLPWANSGVFGVVSRGVTIGLPAFLLIIMFAGLLGSGNAILGAWNSKILQDLLQWIENIDFSFAHLLMVTALATLALVLLRPSEPNPKSCLRMPKLSRMQPNRNRSVAWWRSAIILGSLNVFFFAVNMIDAIYLWVHTQLPDGVTLSQFVHQGVGSLISAVLLSALVLTVLFQQSLEISSSPVLKRLAYGWIVQNLVLIASVLLRLVRYVEAFQLTTQRFYVACFLILVTAGFGLIGRYIARTQSVGRLVLWNAGATFVLFFCLQFLNVADWVAGFNVVHHKHLDIEYLEQLGPPAWPALAQVAASTMPEAREAREWLSSAKDLERASLASRNWRSWQYRRAARVSELLSATRIVPDQP